MSSIRVVPEEEVTKSAGAIPPLLFANLKSLYSRRAERLQALAQAHPLGDYLMFAANIAKAQEKVMVDHPLTIDLTDVLEKSAVSGEAPLSATNYPRSSHWHTLLDGIIAELRPDVSEQIAAVLDNLEKASEKEREGMATALLAGEYAQVGSDVAPFIWSALSLYWAQMATQLPGHARATYGENRQFCPVCNSAPVASMVQIGSTTGLRYLHCSLCESEWHVVRVKCTNCEQTGKLDYWSLDSEHAAVKAESCGDCGSYLKVMYQEKDAKIEAVADDLASLVLDAKMEEENFARSGINPFLFPGE